MRIAFLGTLTLSLLLTSRAASASAPPWVEPGDLPLPLNAQSVLPNHNQVPVHEGPTATSPRRGVLAAGAPLPLFGLKRGPGCAGRWVNIGPVAWVCQDKLQLSSSPFLGAAELVYQPVADGLPYRYFFVGRDGSLGYSRLTAVDVAAPDQEFSPGFAVALVEQQQRYEETYGRTTHGLWVPVRDLVPVRPTAFHGETLEEGNLDFGWVVEQQAPLVKKPGAPMRASGQLVRFQKVPVLEEQSVRGTRYYRVAEGAWVSARYLRKPSRAEPPQEVSTGDRWIDIELATQTLVAYEGDRPVYATLVSTGRGKQNTPFATPIGVHRIWIKLVSSDMDNLEEEEASDYYSIEDVPYVQFFDRGVGLHAAFWHSRFGHVRSHGCVNLPPIDAQWLFGWTAPHLPAGWSAVLPSDLERGTVVRVR